MAGPGDIDVSEREWRGAARLGRPRGIHQTVIPFRFCRVAGGPYVMKSRIRGPYFHGPFVTEAPENSVIFPSHTAATPAGRGRVLAIKIQSYRVT